ncbi:MAG: hypothetical protein RMK99_11960 [Anaerolineales bacterium]|nr:hypothetical protein [Anaerolineales bacterium]
MIREVTAWKTRRNTACTEVVWHSAASPRRSTSPHVSGAPSIGMQPARDGGSDDTLAQTSFPCRQIAGARTLPGGLSVDRVCRRHQRAADTPLPAHEIRPEVEQKAAPGEARGLPEQAVEAFLSFVRAWRYTLGAFQPSLRLHFAG